jgi:hypothetical protein
MSMSNIQPMIEPDPQQMRRHVGHLFEGYLDGCHDGLIELAWTDGRDGRLRHAVMFHTSELDQLVARAVAENREPGQNLYIGQALRKPDVPPLGRGSDRHFFASPAYWVDIDDDVTATASINYRNRGCPPTGVVVTGRHPHLRAQMLWRLKTPLRDAHACRQQNLALAQALGGDATVVNPSRVLRLGGSIAWPLKEGRVIESTQFLEFNDGRPKEYLAEQIARAFPPAQVSLIAPAPKTAPSTADAVQASTDSTSLHIGTSNLSVEGCLARIRAGDHWHNNLIRLTGHWIARGWSDEEILTAAEALTLESYSVDETRREVAAMIAGARRKWALPNFVHEIGEEGAERPQVIDPRTWAGKPLPVREWLVENWIPMHHVTALYGDGGLGKTLLAQQLLTSVATGRPWLGLPVKRLRAFGLLCEDHEADLHLNQERINHANWIDYSQLGDLRLWPSVGFDNLLMTFDGKDTSKGNLTAFFGQLVEAVRSFLARFVVLDTAADLFGGNENIRSQVRQFIANACGRLAREIDGAVLLCAHPSLSGMASGSGSSGSTAWNNTVRSRLYLSHPQADDGEAADPDLRVLTRKKSNYARAGETLTLRWTEGVMVPVATGSEGDDSDVRHRVVEEIDRAWREGEPYSDTPQARTRYVLAHLPRRLGIGRGAVERAYLALLTSGQVGAALHDRHRNLRGLRALRPAGGEEP